MLKNRITLWFLSNSKEACRQFSIRRIWLYGVPAIALTVFAAIFFLLSEFLDNRVSQGELSRLKTENQFLMEKYEKIRWSLAEADARFDQLVSKEIAIRTIFNLPEISNSERQLGTGGPRPLRFTEMTDGEKLAAATESQVDHLLKLSEFELQKFAQVESALQGLRDRLDRTPTICPTQGYFSRGFGRQYDPFTGYQQMHRGVDIANRPGSPIVATASGKVIFSGTDRGGMGNLIEIDHGFGYVTRYGHMLKLIARIGQSVNRGDLIGLVGSTGYSTGPHVHYEVLRNGAHVNPREFILTGL